MVIESVDTVLIVSAERNQGLEEIMSQECDECFEQTGEMQVRDADLD